MECKRKLGGSSEAENDKLRNGSRIIKVAECPDRGSSKLRPATCNRHQFVFHVGISHFSERHSGAAPEVDFRAQLCARDAGAVRFLLRLLPLLDSLVKHRERNRLSTHHGGWLAEYGGGCIPVHTGCVSCLVPVVPGSASCSCRRYHWSASGGKSVRGGFG